MSTKTHDNGPRQATEHMQRMINTLARMSRSDELPPGDLPNPSTALDDLISQAREITNATPQAYGDLLSQIVDLLYDRDAKDWRELRSCADAVDAISEILEPLTANALPWFVVTGRNAFDDEDAAFVVQAPDMDTADRMAYGWLKREADIDPDDTERETYINHVIACGLQQPRAGGGNLPLPVVLTGCPDCHGEPLPDGPGVATTTCGRCTGTGVIEVNRDN